MEWLLGLNLSQFKQIWVNNFHEDRIILISKVLSSFIDSSIEKGAKRQGWITYCACPWHHLFTKWKATWKSSDKLTKEKFCEYVRSASLVKESQVNQRSRKTLLTLSARVFIVFILDRKFYQKDDWEKKSIAGVLASFLQWYVNDLL